MELTLSTLFGGGGILVAIITGFFLVQAKRVEKTPERMAAEDNRILKAAELFEKRGDDLMLETERLRLRADKLAEQSREALRDLESAHLIIRDIVPWADKAHELLEPFEDPNPKHDEKTAEIIRYHRMRHGELPHNRKRK